VIAMPDVISPGPSERPGDELFADTRYSTIRRLAAGGMAEVFLVLHREMGREFVIKVLHERLARSEELLDRMRIEAQTMGRLAHPHIVAVVDFGMTRQGRPFIVMERLVGRTLAAEVAARGALPPPEAVRYTLQLLSALEAAHAVGIVHRDIKPDNLFLVADPDGRLALKVLDFGIARVLPGFGDAAPRPLAVPTDTGLVVGTPRYVSPEGALGKRVDERADVYAAGLIFYLLLAGRGPFDHLRAEAQILRAHANVQPVAPSAAAGDAKRWPSLLDDIILCALRKNPDTRFQSAKQFGEILQEFVDMMNAPLPAPASDHDATAREGSSTTGFLHIPMSAPRLRDLLIFIAITAATALLISQAVRVVLRH
jgi:serine/threonine protein kinase